MSTQTVVGVSDDSDRSEHQARKRLDGELAVLQADRSKYERAANELEAEIRLLERAIADRELEVEERRVERNRMIHKVQDIDAEIVRVKRSSYKH